MYLSLTPVNSASFICINSADCQTGAFAYNGHYLFCLLSGETFQPEFLWVHHLHSAKWIELYKSISVKDGLN